MPRRSTAVSLASVVLFSHVSRLSLFVCAVLLFRLRGRTRLPSSALGFGKDTFKLSDHALAMHSGRHDQYLPVAHTCFFACELPVHKHNQQTRGASRRTRNARDFVSDSFLLCSAPRCALLPPSAACSSVTEVSDSLHQLPRVSRASRLLPPTSQLSASSHTRFSLPSPSLSPLRQILLCGCHAQQAAVCDQVR